MESVNETTSSILTTTLPPIGCGRSSLVCNPRSSWSTTTATELDTSSEKDRRESAPYVVNDPEPSLDNENDNADNCGDYDDDDDDDDNSEELRALTSAAASPDNTDNSSDELADGEYGEKEHQVASVDQTLTSADNLAPLPALSSSSASVLGRIAAGFSTAVSGGLHPLKRSLRVAPEPPSPTPKDFFWGPVMPGYPTSLPDADQTKRSQSTMVIRQTVQLEQTQTSNNSSDVADIGLRQAIPVMPIYLAVFCCLLNAISPGLGTFVAGISLVCCSRPQRENVEWSSLLLVNVWVALFQLISTVLLLAGYVWSLVWAFSFISISREFKSKQGNGEIGAGDSSVSQPDSERSTETGHTSTTTTTAMTRTTTTTVSLPDHDSASASPSVSREPPIIVLQEAPVAPHQRGDALLDAAAAAIWIERQRTLHDASPAASGRDRVARTESGRGSAPRSPMSRRERLNRRRQHSTRRAAAAPRRFNDPLTGVLLCPEALEHIVVHSSIVPDPNAAAGPSGVGGHAQTTSK